MSVTDGDRRTAAILAKSAADGVHAWVTEGQGGYVYSAAIDEIATALAEEREKARAPVLAVPDWDTRYWSVLAATVCKCGHRAIDHELRVSEGQTPCSVCGCGEYRRAAEVTE